MVVLKLSNNNYHSLLENIAKQLKTRPENNSIAFPEDIGQGIMKVIQLPNNLQALMIKVLFKKDVLIKSGYSTEGDYVLNFDESQIFEPLNNASTINSFVRLTGHTFRHWEIYKKNSAIQFVRILFNKSWLSSYIGLSEKMSVFEKYIPMKSEAGEKEKLNEEYRRIINEMWNVSNQDFLQNICYNNRILLLIEQFFSKMHAEMLSPKGKYKLTADDVLKLKKIEAKLNLFTMSPPKIKDLAKRNLMSPPKLSQAFKQVYGISIYNYYQKQRMQKAHELLTSRQFSVKEVSTKLGYTNFSNFVLAFKKQFNENPKSLLE